MVVRARLLVLVGIVAASLVLPALSADSRGTQKKVISASKVDESLEHIDVFAGIEQGILDVKMLPQDALGGNLLIENKGPKPLNVDVPPAFIGKQVLKQFPGLQPAVGNGGPGGAGPGGQPGGNGAQVLGGGIGQPQNNGAVGNPGGAGRGNGNANGNGFFSVPTDKIIRVAYRSACLEHGKLDPTPRMTYRISKVEEFSDDPVLEETLKIVALGEHDPQAGQAAAWHVANKLTWKQLSEKTILHIGRPATRYFTAETIARAQKIHATAVARVKELDEKSIASADLAAESARSPGLAKRD